MSDPNARRILFRRARLAVVGVVALIAIAVIGGSAHREKKRQESLDAVIAPFSALGFTLVETSGRGDPTKLTGSAEAGCVVATSVKPAKLKLTHTSGTGSGTIEGDGPIIACLCDAATLTVTSDKSAAGMALLRMDASGIGGARGFPFLGFKPGTTAASDAACTEAELDAWIEAKKAPDTKVTGDTVPFQSALAAAGFLKTNTIAGAKPFGVVDVPANTCALVSQGKKTDPISLRLKGGGIALGPASGNLLWCTSAATTVLVVREGTSDIEILSGPAEKLGGIIGVQEAAYKDGVTIAARGVPDGDRAWIAKQALLASWIPDSLIITGVGTEDGAPEKEARIASVSVAKVGALTPESPEGVFSFCEPALDGASESICVFSGVARWHLEGANITGIARAKTPYWLFGFQNAPEPAAMKLETQLITLARRLKRQGFEPTTLEAVTENDKGAEVLGRANEDAFVALTLSAMEPWVVPFVDVAALEAGTAAWTLDGDPRIVPIKPLQRIQVIPAGKSRLPPKASRRTLVFRRHS